MSANYNLWYSWKLSISLILSLRVTLKYMMENLENNIFNYDSISAVSMGNHMMALYDLSILTNKQLKDMGKIMSFIKVSLDDDDKKDIFDLGQQYNEIFAWFIWNHYNHEMVFEFKKVIEFIESDIECFCNVIFHKHAVEQKYMHSR